MTGVQYTGTLTGADGSTLTVTAATLTAAAVVPPAVPPATPVPPANPTQVRIGTAVFPLAGTNVARAADQLVRYTGPAAATTTNQWGAEAPVWAGVVTGVNDRQPTGSAAGTPIPAGGYVLSGHGAARTWLLANARTGVAVELLGPTSTPTPAPTPPATVPVMPPGTRTVGVYLMLWAGRTADVPPEATQVRLAFGQGTPLQLVGSGAQTPAQLAAWAAAFRARGGQVLLSVGGQGGQVSTADRAGFVAAVRAIAQQVPLDGIDWDIEASALSVVDVVAISKALDAEHGAEWVTSFIPSGGPPVAAYLDAAVQCYSAGLRVQFSQQLYDTPVSESVAIDCTRRAVDAGLPPSSVLVAMMVAPDADHWTVDQCVANMAAIRAVYPSIGGAVLWEASRPGTSDWAARITAALA